MSERAKTVLKAGVLVGLLFAGPGLVVTRIRSLRTGEEGWTWFYDQSEQELYAVPLGTTAASGNRGTRRWCVCSPWSLVTVRAESPKSGGSLILRSMRLHTRS